jgi:hypothetical protein
MGQKFTDLTGIIQIKHQTIRLIQCEIMMFDISRQLENQLFGLLLIEADSSQIYLRSFNIENSE